MGYNLRMVSKLTRARRALHVVTPDDRWTPEFFYDTTIEQAWPLALALHDGDRTAAAEALVASYRHAWQSGRRDRSAVLALLVEDARRARRQTAGVVLPFARASRGETPPPMPA